MWLGEGICAKGLGARGHAVAHTYSIEGKRFVTVPDIVHVQILAKSRQRFDATSRAGALRKCSGSLKADAGNQAAVIGFLCMGGAAERIKTFSILIGAMADPCGLGNPGGLQAGHTKAG